MLNIKNVLNMLNKSNKMSKSNITLNIVQSKSVLVHVCFVLLIVCLYICVCECLLQDNNNCAQLVCISVVIGLLAVWRHNKPKTKNQKSMGKAETGGLTEGCYSCKGDSQGLPW